MYKPTDLHNHLHELGTGPKKHLSQNFLIDGNIVRKIVETAEVKPDDVVLEIGPGPGALTQELLKAGAHVIAVEKDRVLAAGLEKLQTEDKRLTIFCEDVMTFPLEMRLTPFLKSGQKVKVISNLPYHLTTPILKHLIEGDARHLLSHLVVMVQDEVARRFTAVCGSADYSSVSIFLSFYSNPRYAFKVSNQCFYPKPKVQSAVVVLEIKEPPLSKNRDAFFKLTRTSFEHRRKMLRSSLSEIYLPADVMNALEKIHLKPTARPEELSLEQFLQLFKLLQE